MQDVISITFVNASPEEFELLQPLWRRVGEALADHPGFISTSGWSAVDGVGEYAVITHYADRESLESAIEKLLDIIKEIADVAPTPDIRRMQVARRTRALMEATQLFDFMSFSARRSEPGYSEDLLMEVDSIFESLQYIPGYIGGAYGRNFGNDEEIDTMILWHTKEAYEASLPGHAPLYRISLYERIM